MQADILEAWKMFLCSGRNKYSTYPQFFCGFILVKSPAAFFLSLSFFLFFFSFYISELSFHIAFK